MELLISAATARQLVMGKILGIGLAGPTQVTARPRARRSSLVAVRAVIGNELSSARGPGVATSLAGLSPGLLLAFLVYFTLGFALYASIYAAARARS